MQVFHQIGSVILANYATSNYGECNLSRIIDSSPSGAHKMYFEISVISLSQLATMVYEQKQQRILSV